LVYGIVCIMVNMSNRNDYQYNTISDLGDILKKDITTHFAPFFSSFNLSKKTFIFQSINLILVILFIKIALSPFLDKITNGVDSVSNFSIQVVLIIFLSIFLSTVSSISILKWQTLYSTSYNLTKKLTLLFCLLVVSIYLKFYGPTRQEQSK